MKTVTITLLDSNGQPVKELAVDPEKILQASVIVHEGAYYVYKDQSGRFLTDVSFVRCKDPVVLE